MTTRIRLRDLLMVLAGVACLLLKRWFARYLGDFAFSYVGNLSASFAVYFLVSFAAASRLPRLVIAGIAFGPVIHRMLHLLHADERDLTARGPKAGSARQRQQDSGAMSAPS